MKISSRIDGSICCTILLNRQFSKWPIPGYLGNGFFDAKGRTTCSRAGLDSLHGARCRRKQDGSHSFSSSTILNDPSRREPGGPPYFKAAYPNSLCHNYTSAVHGSPDVSQPPPVVRSKEELLGLVDQYDSDSVDEHFEFHRDPYLRGYAPANGPNLTVSNRRDEVVFPGPDEVSNANAEQQQLLRGLRKAVLLRLRSPHRSNPEDIYKIYVQLPEPRMPYIPWNLRAQLLRSLGSVEKKDSTSMLRYFSVVADVKNSGLSLTRAQWNAAMSFASRYVGVSTDVEAESALSLWREMEQDAGIKADDVTFNILFDVASKAGKFTLAEMIYKEMESRGFTFNRFHHVSLIHFFGLKMDGGGVRAAYREMVEAGEIIDTVVLNCVMAGFLRSGEEDAAERVYERMRVSHPHASDMPERNYVANKVVTRVLMMFARLGRDYPSMRPAFQAVASITPDLQTYRILINHYAIKVGDLHRVVQYLDEMKWFRIPLHGAIFLALFKGFQAHGGFAGSDWSEQRLRSVWAAFLQAFDDGATGLYIQTWLASWALRAFAKCTSSEGVLKAYDDLSSRWDLDQADSEFMMNFLHGLLKRSALHRPDYLPSVGRQEKKGDRDVPATSGGQRTASGSE